MKHMLRLQHARLRMATPHKALAWAFVALLLSACTSNGISRQQIDAPMLFLGANEVDCLANPNQSCWLVVQSESLYNDSGLDIKRNECFSITVPSGQFWYDRDRQVPAPTGDNGSDTTQHFSYIKRNPAHNWFALMATVDGKDELAIYVGDGKPFNNLQGRLSFYVNDARGFYGNNQGRIRIRIDRQEPRKCSSNST